MHYTPYIPTLRTLHTFNTLHTLHTLHTLNTLHALYTLHTYVHYITYMHTHIPIQTYIPIHAHTYQYIPIHTYIHTYIHAYIHTYIHTNTYIHTHTHVHVHVCMRLCSHVNSSGLISMWGKPGRVYVGAQVSKLRGCRTCSHDFKVNERPSLLDVCCLFASSSCSKAGPFIPHIRFSPALAWKPAACTPTTRTQGILYTVCWSPESHASQKPKKSCILNRGIPDSVTKHYCSIMKASQTTEGTRLGYTPES